MYTDIKFRIYGTPIYSNIIVNKESCQPEEYKIAASKYMISRKIVPLYNKEKDEEIRQ
jgi:hypothetical protein